MKTKRMYAGIFTSCLLLFSVVIGVFWYTTQQSKNMRSEFIVSQIHLIAGMQADQVTLLLQGKRNRVIDFSSDGKIKETLRAIHENQDEAAMTTLTNHLITNKLPIDSSFYEVYAMDLSGTVVASTNEVNIGTNLDYDPIYTYGKEHPYVKNIAFDSIAKVPYFNVSAPVVDTNTGIVGIIAIKMSADAVNAIMLQNYSDFATESYIINDERYLVTPSKYLGGDNKGVLAQTVDTGNAYNCTQAIARNETADQMSEVKEYINYAGKKILGTYHIIDDFNWCVLVETEL